MPASTATIVAVTAANSAVIASQNARIQAQRHDFCEQFMQTYDTKTATVEARRDYADCVRTLYGTGEPMTGTEVILLKVLVVILLASSVFGGFHEWKTERSVWFSFFGAIFIPLFVGAFLFLLFAACSGIAFLFS